MALKGDLASVDLAQVFQMLALNQKVGMLCITSPRGWRALYFEQRGATLFFNEHTILDKVLLQATRTGRLADQSVQDARDHAAMQGGHLADSLIAGSYLTEVELTSMVRTEIEEEVYDLFFWNDATFEFYEGASTVAGREGRIDERFFFSTDTLIMEAARRIDEWSFIQERVRGPLEIFRPIAGRSSNILDLEDSALTLYDLVDGKRNVARLIEITGLPSFVVYKGLALLLDDGLVDHVDPADLLHTAHECVQEGRFQDAINLFERAIALGEGIPDSHEQAARVYETIKEYELAAYHHKCVAEFYAGNEDHRRAVEILRHVVSMLPTDLAARERLVELTVGRPEACGKGFDPIANGKELVDLYLAVGEIERVRSILERLLRDNPFDVELKKSLINVHSKAGDTKRVVELYESIAEDLVQQREPIEAVKYLQKILMLDRNRKDISERIRSLYVMDERRRSRRRSLIALTAIALFMVALSAIWWLYEQHARDRLIAVEARVEKLLEQEDYNQAAAAYRAFTEQFPLTLVSREVESELAHVDGLKAKHEQRLENELRKHRLELEKIRSGYKAAWRVYQGHVRAHALDKALDQLETVATMVERAGEPQDAEWAKSVKLDQERRELKDYIAQAFDIDRRASEKLDAGDWQAARGLLLKLIDEFGMTDTAAHARLPVMIQTRPAGAAVLQGGKPMVKRTPNGELPLRTPCVVLCDQGPQSFELRMQGFESAAAKVDPHESATCEIVLTATPIERFTFAEPVRGALSVDRGFLATGLRGGRIALTRVQGDRERRVIRLPGLEELEGKVAFTSNSAIFATSESKLVSYSLSTGERIWEVSLSFQPAHDILVRDGRILFVDTQGRLIAIDASRGGKPLWFTALGGSIAGSPEVEGRFAFICLHSGQILHIDLLDGTIVGRFMAQSPPVTPVHPARGALVFGTESGEVTAVREDGQRTLWTVKLPAGTVASALAITDDYVIVATSGDQLVRIGLRSGEIEAKVDLGARLVAGPFIRPREVLISLRRVGKSHRDSELLQARDLEDLGLRWEFGDESGFSAELAVQDGEVWVADSKGEVLRFR